MGEGSCCRGHANARNLSVGNCSEYKFFVTRHPILFLNGTSSAGKTTVAKAFQRLWHDPALYASVDSFIFMFADHVLKNDKVRKV
ncbi:MAG: hypothetical protein ACAI34_24470, partial [Verrucomicrobium sp.]